MDSTLKQDIINLCSIKDRTSASKGEHEASVLLKNRLDQIGLDTIVENFSFSFSFAKVLMLCAIFGIIAAWIPYSYLIISIILFALAIISYFGECTSEFIFWRKIFPFQKSTNVIGKIQAKQEKLKIIISAHYDTAHCGCIYNPYIVNKVGPTKIGPLLLPFILLCCLAITWFVGIFTGIFILKLIFSILLGIFVILLMQYELAPPTPGAADNASGVAIVLSLAEHLKINNIYPDISFYFLLTGSEESHMIGMQKFMKKHKNEFDKNNTFFINFDTIGSSKLLKYTVSEGFMITQKYLPYLVSLTAKLENLFDIKPIHITGHTDALIPAILGYNSINFISFNENNVPDHYHWFTDIPDNIIIHVLERCKNCSLALIDLINKNNH